MFRSPHAFVITARCFLILLVCGIFGFTLLARPLAAGAESALFGGAAFLGFMLAILAFPWNRKEDVSRGVALTIGAAAVIRMALVGDMSLIFAFAAAALGLLCAEIPFSANKMRALSRRFGNVPFDVIRIELAREERRSRKLVIAAHNRKRAARRSTQPPPSALARRQPERVDL